MSSWQPPHRTMTTHISTYRIELLAAQRSSRVSRLAQRGLECGSALLIQYFRSTFLTMLSPHPDWRERTMTASNKHHHVQALPHWEDNRGLEQRYPPASLLLAGTVLVMNACATLLSLMA
jgi:hypothetical protein